jgi:hypothetical protein
MLTVKITYNGKEGQEAWDELAKNIVSEIQIKAELEWIRKKLLPFEEELKPYPNPYQIDFMEDFKVKITMNDSLPPELSERMKLELSNN